MKNKERIRYTCRGYKYAPESFIAYRVLIDQSGGSNHAYEMLPFSPEENREIGYMRITEGRERAEALIKHKVRKQEKQPRKYIAYGFRDKDASASYYYCEQLRVLPSADVKNRLTAYKKFKSYLLAQDCKISYCTEAKLDGQFRPQEVREIFSTVDITKPLVINLIIKDAA